MQTSSSQAHRDDVTGRGGDLDAPQRMILRFFGLLWPAAAGACAANYYSKR